MENKNSNNSVIWLVLILAIIGIMIAWAAFNRSGEDLLPTAADEANEAAEESERAVAEIEEETEEAAAEAARASARIEARADLVALRARLEAEEGYADAVAEVQEIEADLDQAYANASAEAREEYAEIKTELGVIEDKLRDGTGDVLEFIAGTILLLEDDVRVDEDAEGGNTNDNSDDGIY